MLTDYCNLYVLPPLVEAGERLGEPRYIEAARRAVEYFRRKTDLVTFKPQSGTFTHMFGYMMEALVDLVRSTGRKGLAQAEAIQRPDGSIRLPGCDMDLFHGNGAVSDCLAQNGKRNRG